MRYLARMTGRPTPFGFFAGISIGTITGENRIELVPRQQYQRHLSLDIGFLFKLCEEAARNRPLRKKLQYYVNSSLHRICGRYRYVEQIWENGHQTSTLVELEEDDLVNRVLEATPCKASFARLVSLVRKDFDTREDAEEYINDLVDRQILLPDIPLSISGNEPLKRLIEFFQSHTASPIAGVLKDVRRRLFRIGAGKPGSSLDEIRRIPELLETISGKTDAPHYLHGDLVKPAAVAHLSEHVIRDLLDCTQVLANITAQPSEDLLRRFRASFEKRYGEEEVELVKALEEDTGIGYPMGEESSDLVRDLDLIDEEKRVIEDSRHGFLLFKLGEALSCGGQAIHLSRKDIQSLTFGKAAVLPDSFAAMFTLVAKSPVELALNKYEIMFHKASGPSGANYLGRFCHASTLLKKLVHKHIRQEEKLRPDAIFAEIVHVPESRIGSIVSRPSLREYEIPYLGHSLLKCQFQIPVSDLLVSVHGNRVVLRSKKNQVEVIPRMTNGHRFSISTSGIYRFLCDVQRNEAADVVEWSWGSLSEFYFLPRLQYGRYIFATARWMVRRDELAGLFRAEDAAKFQAFQSWRELRRLPRWVCFAEFDQRLPLDLENILCIDTLLALVQQRLYAVVEEMFPSPDELCVTGPEGRFVHEMIVPFVRRKVREERPDIRYDDSISRLQREFLPGSDWLFLKMYTSESLMEELLCDSLEPAIRTLLRKGWITRWFFIRYKDPQTHLRLRLQGKPQVLLKKVLPALLPVFGYLQGKGNIRRLQLDTYTRETERYGGVGGLLFSEELFQIDSESVVSILKSLRAGEDPHFRRWELALYGIHRYLCDFGFSLAERRDLMRTLSDSFKDEFAVNSRGRMLLGRKFRKEKDALLGLLQEEIPAGHPLTAELQILKMRSRRLGRIVRKLKTLWEKGKLTRHPSALCASFIHMHANRMLRSAWREQELVIYDFLFKMYETEFSGRVGRKGRGGEKQVPPRREEARLLISGSKRTGKS